MGTTVQGVDRVQNKLFCSCSIWYQRVQTTMYMICIVWGLLGELSNPDSPRQLHFDESHSPTTEHQVNREALITSAMILQSLRLNPL